MYVDFISGIGTSRAEDMDRRRRFLALETSEARAEITDRDRRFALAVDSLMHAVGPALTNMIERYRVPHDRHFPERICMHLAIEFSNHAWLNEATFRAGIRDAARIQAMCIGLNVRDVTSFVIAVTRYGGAFGQALRAWARDGIYSDTVGQCVGLKRSASEQLMHLAYDRAGTVPETGREPANSVG